MDTPQEKICTKCKISKPLDDFRNDKYRRDGKSPKCRECCKKRDKELYDLNPEAHRASTARWTATHPEKVQAYVNANKEKISKRRRERYGENPEKELRQNAAWYEANKEARAITMAAWEAANKEKRKAQKAAKYLENAEAILAKNAAWEAAHPGYGAVKWERRRSRQAGAEIVDLSPAQFEEIKAAFNNRCAYCPPDCKECKKKTHDLHQEHITPVAQGGNYTVHNIVPSCMGCNSKKGAGAPLAPVQPLLLTVAPPRTPRKRKASS